MPGTIGERSGAVLGTAKPGMTNESGIELSIPLAHVDEMSGDCCRRGHGRRHEMGAALVALAAFEIAVRCRRAALAGRELVGIHGKTHRAAGLAPFEASIDENLVEAFRLRLRFDEPGAG